MLNECLFCRIPSLFFIAGNQGVVLVGTSYFLVGIVNLGLDQDF